MRRAVAVVLAVVAATTATAATATTPNAVSYQPPVDAAVSDPFRPPASDYGSGNRGVDYATDPGTGVAAAARGQVTFAGRVGGGLHVVVLHADGIRTSYSFLASVEVRRGQWVEAGQRVGTSAASLHFGARAGDAYLDPLLLLSGAGRALIRLVPDSERSMGTEAGERSGLRRMLGAVTGAVSGAAGAVSGAAGAVSGAAAVGVDAAAWAGGAAIDGAEMVGHAVPTPEELWEWGAAAGLGAVPSWALVPWTVGRTWAAQSGCTSSATPPPRPSGRRRAVLVGGLGSTSDGASVDDVATATLGYAREDVVRFSYRGGTTSDNPYGAADTQVDIRESGRRLRELLERIHAADPGVPIDVYAHSQGGLVARSALGPRAPPTVANLITLGSPHGGADLATIAANVSGTIKGAIVQLVVARTEITSINPMSTSVRQMAEGSDFIRDLRAQPLPAGVRVTSIGARQDVVVPTPRSRLPGATNVVVNVPRFNDHSDLPGSPAATREIGLALAGMGPTCQGLADITADVVVGEVISTGEDLIGTTLVVALR